MLSAFYLFLYSYVLLLNFSNYRHLGFVIWYSKINSSIAIEFFIIFFYLTARSFVNWRALNIPIRTINTTISFFRFKFIFAIRTLPDIQTIIGRHLFSSLLMTLWTCDCWLELNVSHRVSLAFLGFSLQTFDIIIRFLLKRIRTIGTSTKKHFPSCNFHTYSLLQRFFC